MKKLIYVLIVLVLAAGAYFMNDPLNVHPALMLGVAALMAFILWPKKNSKKDGIREADAEDEPL